MDRLQCVWSAHRRILQTDLIDYVNSDGTDVKLSEEESTVVINANQLHYITHLLVILAKNILYWKLRMIQNIRQCAQNVNMIIIISTPATNLHL